MSASNRPGAGPEGPARDDSDPPAQAEGLRRLVAVAVHQGGRADAPRIVASGRGAVAEQILGIAFSHGVRVREDADLAEILGAVDVDCEIPLEALAAVAEILSYVYRANARPASSAAADPSGEVPSEGAPPEEVSP